MGYPTISSYAKAYVRARAEAHMNCSITINRGARDVTFDRTTGAAVANPGALIYTGKARIWDLDKGSTANIQETVLALQRTTISIPWSTPTIPDIDDVITITACPGDTDVVGRSFRVTGVDGAGLSRATRRMTCVTLAESGDWRP